MFDRADATFASHLEREIIKVLSGDDDTPGLYRSVLSVQSWDAFTRTAGMIQAYENVLTRMREVARRMHGDEKTARQTDKSVN